MGKMNIYYPGEKSLEGITDLCVAAHQDDIEIMAYGPISDCYDGKGKAFAGVVVADGAGSPRAGEYANYTDEEMKQVRVSEQQRAADVGRYRAAIQLGFSSAEIKNPENTDTVQAIYELLMKIKPRRLYTHNPADKHPTHVGVALRTIAAVRMMPSEARPECFTGLEVWRSLDWLPDEDKLCLDTAKRPSVQRELLTVHKSQVEGGKRYDKAAMGRRYANATFFASHNTDSYSSMNFGIDLMPLLDSDVSVSDYICSYIDKFRSEVIATIGGLSK